MIRTCDGTDPKVIRHPHDPNGQHCPKPLRFSYGTRCACDPAPCDCGARFNDDDRLRLFPHMSLIDRHLIRRLA